MGNLGIGNDAKFTLKCEQVPGLVVLWLQNVPEWLGPSVVVTPHRGYCLAHHEFRAFSPA